jgi:transcriptional regulator with XRE-family HTH domain
MADTDRDARERFAANIERLRRRDGLSVEELAARADVDARELEEILGADREAAYGTIAALAGALGVEVGELFEGIRWTPPGDE